MDGKLKITREGLMELEKEYKNRVTKIREKIANDIELAREQGDLSENAAYKAAMDEKEFNEKKIVELEDMIKNSIVIKETQLKNKIDIGVSVTLLNKDNNQKIDYEIVGASEANPSEYKISIESPLGLALIGRKKGDLIEYKTPIGVNNYLVLDIK